MGYSEDDKKLIAKLKSGSNGLSDEEIKILDKKYGIFGDCMTLEEIGEILKKRLETSGVKRTKDIKVRDIKGKGSARKINLKKYIEE
jgi:hypothetical protein